MESCDSPLESFIESTSVLEQQILQLLHTLAGSSEAIRNSLARQKEHSVALWSPQRFTTCGEAKEGLELPGELASPRPTTFTSIVPAQRGGLSPPVPTVSAVSVGVCRHTVQQAVHSAAKEPEVKEVDPGQTVFIDAKALKKKLKEDLCKETLFLFKAKP
ncbi:unnamed protein product [Durusdinium trenchii]|uniref:Uncharacterized protein n=1 Tax=Durusdinium trenchii TaxID=1381693 RepID=A0ABP0RNR6_9DINO